MLLYQAGRGGKLKKRFRSRPINWGEKKSRREKGETGRKRASHRLLNPGVRGGGRGEEGKKGEKLYTYLFVKAPLLVRWSL